MAFIKHTVTRTLIPCACLVVLAVLDFTQYGSIQSKNHEPEEVIVQSGITRESLQSRRYLERAKQLADEMLIVDAHIDAPMKQYYQSRDLTVLRDDTEFDIPRSFAGGLNVAFMSIYTSASAATEGTSKEIAEIEIDFVETLAEQAPDRVGVATCTADIALLREQDRLALPLGMENGSPLGGDVTQLGYWYDKGIRYITLAHSRSNEFADSSYDENERWNGLSDAGKDLVKEMNQKGVIIDISHLTDRAAWQVLELSTAPVVATHSSLRHFIPGFHRNMPDDMVVALGEQGGLIMLNFGSSFVSAESRKWSDAMNSAVAEFNQEQDKSRDEIGAFRDAYRAQNPFPFATVGTVADHIDHVVELAGVEHVGFGSDYEGVGPTLPIGLEDVSKYPNLVAELLRRGYSEPELELILGQNFMRVWEQVEQLGADHGNPPACRH